MALWVRLVVGGGVSLGVNVALQSMTDMSANTSGLISLIAALTAIRLLSRSSDAPGIGHRVPGEDGSEGDERGM